MNAVHTMLPRMVLNGSFMREFISAPAPCLGMGLVEQRKQEHPFFGIRPKGTLPDSVAQQGFRLGHSLMGTSRYLVVHFTFEFYGHSVYHVLVRPDSPVVQTVFKKLAAGDEYFIFVLTGNGKATAFSAGGSDNELAVAFQDNLPKVLNGSCSEADYRSAKLQLTSNPLEPAGDVLNWVCRDETYLDLTTDRFDLTPSH